MSYHVSVRYPNHKDTTFDISYYINSHMPLVEKLWKPLGLLKWEVVEYGPAADGTQAEHRVATFMTWKDEASFTAAAGNADAHKIFGDVPNFCNHESTSAVGKIAGSG